MREVEPEITRQTTEVDLDEETIKVICYREDGLWYALGLEVSILGHGETFEEAVSLLEELIQDQIEFCNRPLNSEVQNP